MSDQSSPPGHDNARGTLLHHPLLLAISLAQACLMHYLLACSQMQACCSGPQIVGAVSRIINAKLFSSVVVMQLQTEEHQNMIPAMSLTHQ